MKAPEELRYTPEHEWVSVKGTVATVGITDYAQGELGDVVYLELPEVGAEVSASEPFGSIEAVKTVADLFAPLTGKVQEVNSELVDQPELVNTSPYGDGWIVRIKIADPGEVEDLLSAAQYRELVEEGAQS